MLTREQHLHYCQRCINRQFDPQQGLVCKLTGKVADFDPTCPSFQVDETVKIETQEAAPVLVEAKDIPDNLREIMRKHQDLPYAIIGGLAAAIVGAIIWGTVTYFTHYQIGYMAIGVGLLVGFSVRYFGAGVDLPFGIVGAFFAVFGCALGNLLSQVGFLAEAESMGYFEVIPYLNWSVIEQIYRESFSPMDVLFYGIAGYEGYRFAFRSLSQEMVRDGVAPPVPYANLRFPLVAGLFVILSVGAIMIYRGNSTTKTIYYESGAKHYEGLVVNGKEQGLWTFWWENGQVQQKGYFTEAKADSVWEYFDENGFRYRSGRFVNNMQHGEWTDYFPNGKTSATGFYSMGRMHGPWISYHDSGQVKQRGFYRLDQPDSLFESIAESGAPTSSGRFKNSRPFGLWKYWFENGKPSLEAEFDENGYMRIRNMWTEEGQQPVKDGNGTYSVYYLSGAVMESGRIANTERVGIWRQFSEDGKTVEEGEYRSGVYYVMNTWSPEGDRQVVKGEGTYKAFKDDAVESGKISGGLREGQWIRLTSNGDTIQVTNYAAGQLHGRSVSFQEGGEIASEGMMKQNIQDGEWKWYHPNGLLQTSAVFVNGRKQGEQVFLDEDGELIRTEIYKDGNRVDVRIP